MKRPVLCSILLVAVLSCALPALPQQQAATSVIVPRLIRFGGVLKDSDSKPLSGVAGVTFALYKDQEGGTALWLETQNVSLDTSGHYSVLLGATKEEGVPMDLFTSGQAQWLGVHVQGQPEQPRVWMVSVPYALKAADADTLGGLPASAFARAGTPATVVAPATQPTAPTTLPVTGPPCGSLTSTGTELPNQLPVFTTTPCKLGPSQLFENGTNVGISTKTPAAKLDANGSAIIRGTLNLPATGTASSAHTAGFPSQPLDLLASAWNTSGTPAAKAEHFRWQAEPAGSNTASTSGTLNLLFASGTNPLAETGLKISGNGRITFAPGQTIPTVTGNETVTGNVSASQLISTVATGISPLQVTSTTQVPNLNASFLGGKASSAYALLGASNSFVGDQGVTGNVTATGMVKGSAASFKGGNSTSVIVSQTGTGDGIDVISAGEGIVVETTGSLAIVTNNGISSFVNSNVPALHGVNSSGGTAGQFDGSVTVTTPGVSGTNTTALIVSNTDSNNNDMNFGVNASTTSILGEGVKGTHVASSAAGTGALFCCGGVQGDSGLTGGIGVVGTADDGIGVFALTSSGGDTRTPTLLAGNLSTVPGALVFAATGGFNSPGAATCTIDVSANLTCSGKKSAVVPVDNGQKMVALYAEESPENWFADYGSGQLANGSATVSLEPTYAQTVNTNLGYHVFLTPNGDCNGLFVANKTATAFEVHELKGGHSSVAFDYRIIAKRKGTEEARLEDKTAMMKAAEANATRFRSKPVTPAKLASATTK